ncbi:MAG: WS/DGAT domain-containing protein, partial [Actinomycetota bacterium]|nr:WS/DGAT domain-containing protein [Actinomycetota bacterium]
ADLVAALRGLAREPARLALAERRALAHIGALNLDAEIAALPGLPRHHGARPLSALDAFFAHAATPTVSQQVGAVLLLDDEHPLGPPEQLAGRLAALITNRTSTLPMLRRRLDLRRDRRPRWLPVDDVDPARHLRARTVGAAYGVPWSAALQEFFGTPVPLDRPPWQLEVVHDADAGRTALLAKMHHSLGDGLAVTATLIGLLSDREELPAPQHSVPSYLGPQPAAGWRIRTARARRVLRGLVSLATTALSAPPGGPIRPSTAARDYAMVELPAARVRATARQHGVGTTALLLALVGEALHRIDPAGTSASGRLRAMVPQTTRAVRRPGSSDHYGDGSYRGNHTAAVAVELPVGPMPVAWRVVAVAAELARVERADQPAAAQIVINTLGRLPAPLHARLVRAMYRRRFFTLIASVLPGPRKAHYVQGVQVVSVFPVLPLADGVGLGIGFLTWGDMVGVGVATDTGLCPGADRVANALRSAFDDVATDTSDAHRAPKPARE